MFAKNYHLHWIARRANIFDKYIISIFFKFGRGFCGSFPMLFPKAQASCFKKILNLFLQHCTYIFMRSKKLSQIFKILFQTEDINISVLPGVFLVDMFNCYFECSFWKTDWSCLITGPTFFHIFLLFTPKS